MKQGVDSLIDFQFWRGVPWLCMARPSWAGQGTARRGRGLLVDFQFWRGWARRGAVRRGAVRRGAVRRGVARQGEAWFC